MNVIHSNISSSAKCIETYKGYRIYFDEGTATYHIFLHDTKIEFPDMSEVTEYIDDISLEDTEDLKEYEVRYIDADDITHSTDVVAVSDKDAMSKACSMLGSNCYRIIDVSELK